MTLTVGYDVNDEAGKWCEFEKGVSFLIWRNRRVEHLNQQEKIKAKYLEQFADEDGNIAEGDTRQMLFEIAATSLVSDWRGVKLPNGKPAKYDVKLMMQLCDYTDNLFAWVIEQASDLSNFHAEKVTKTAKKSPRRKGG